MKEEREILINLNGIQLKGNLSIPENSKGLIIFSHGSGSSRMSPRNRLVAGTLQQKGFATLLFDLLTAEEDQDYQKRFDINLLTGRLISVSRWISNKPGYKNWKLGYFGASTGTASALKAAAMLGPEQIRAVVSRGGRPDLAGESLTNVECPVLLLVGGLDDQVIKLNEDAFQKLKGPKKLEIIPGATHLFEETGKLELVTMHASEWFLKYLYQYDAAKAKDFLR